ncbi:phosphatase [Pseudoflavonifractor sp. MSJ-37]|uniref:phosphatase n=1 Tax=Pseudoflavonifractor sp. MSJ-37 TaxID=2841531 RepID=UPI001C0F9992|nr:phosphatase [Pseudoflavonifractor sp. MSJ-37]MBU5434211.1 phosphatase [Pseudoflavonifractor sp. MSJ-37]
MKHLLDSHTHTVASGHAYCTLLEMVRAAADQGLELICITDHAPAMEGTTCPDYFANLGVIDREIFGVQVMAGVELDLLDSEGHVDLDHRLLARTDMAIVSLHTKCIPTGDTAEAYTNGLVRAMEDPYINIIGHPDDGRYPLDYPTLVRAAADHGVLLEVNNSSLTPGGFRQNAPVHCAEMLKICKKEGVPVVIGSDAHFFSYVGRHQYAEALLKELDFPEELVLNRDPAAFRAVIQTKRAQARKG